MRNYKTKLRLNNCKSINNLMARTINSFIDGTIKEDEARTIGYLANILYKGVEQLEKLDLEEQKSRIEHTKAKTQNIRSTGSDIEDLSEVIQEIYKEAI